MTYRKDELHDALRVIEKRLQATAKLTVVNPEPLPPAGGWNPDALACAAPKTSGPDDDAAARAGVELLRQFIIAA